MYRRRTSIYFLRVLVIGLGATFASSPLAAPRQKVRPTTAPKLSVVTHKGQPYYRAFRVTSAAGLGRIQRSDPFKFFHGGGQYGEAFYLFHTIKDARTFAGCEKARGAGSRNVIAEVLLPKKRFDEVKKVHISKGLDWAMNRPRGDASRDKLNSFRSSSHLLFGRWADSPNAKEPFYKPMLGVPQIGVVQRGMPSILHEALIREVEKTK